MWAAAGPPAAQAAVGCTGCCWGCACAAPLRRQCIAPAPGPPAGKGCEKVEQMTERAHAACMLTAAAAHAHNPWVQPQGPSSAKPGLPGACAAQLAPASPALPGSARSLSRRLQVMWATYLCWAQSPMPASGQRFQRPGMSRRLSSLVGCTETALALPPLGPKAGDREERGRRTSLSPAPSPSSPPRGRSERAQNINMSTPPIPRAAAPELRPARHWPPATM
jgi:hypothetical protein